MTPDLHACAPCGHRWYLRREACPRCGSQRVSTAPASGPGTVAAVTVVHRAPREGHPPTPFGLCLVDLAEGVRVMCRCEPGLAPGAEVRVAIEGGLAWARRS
ncbi:Zn-ribbon domain-containing OB-fold protein [Pseudonocardia benzenivorans]|uniref:ChsH2 C-terminal OB-fold domain-containing protein n=2 Tax=Pseudonocardia TaxID=1847 RepID=F4CY77_PSEUX|nr:OB-fold domain-containing protein [Pseudonocardia dioxanivorans]AEA24699.1 protein of unknown function DUF35 [Pseudonocardia dioxanivorans CB1190]